MAGAAGLVAGTGCAQIPDERRTRKKKRTSKGVIKGVSKGTGLSKAMTILLLYLFYQIDAKVNLDSINNMARQSQQS